MQEDRIATHAAGEEPHGMFAGLHYPLVRYQPHPPPALRQRGSGGTTCPGAFIDDTYGNVVCGVCLVALERGHCAVHSLYEHIYPVLHAWFVVGALARGATPTPLFCPDVGCRIRHNTPLAVKAVSQGDLARVFAAGPR